MVQERPLLAVLRQRPLMGALLGQMEGGPIIGSLLRMKPEARGTFLKEIAIDILAQAIGAGLTRLVSTNLSEFLGMVPRRGGS